jgi:hypothetical protein
MPIAYTVKFSGRKYQNRACNGSLSVIITMQSFQVSARSPFEEMAVRLSWDWIQGKLAIYFERVDNSHKFFPYTDVEC